MPFSILNTARQGMAAAQAGIDVTGQNVANLNTPGYTRQRVEQSAASPLHEMGLGRVGRTTNGQGVNIDGVSRLSDVILEGRVRQTSSNAGYTAARAEAFARVEDIHGEPSDHSISSSLDSFWAAWQDLANSPGEQAHGWVVIEKAGELARHVSAGRAAVEDAWSTTRTSAEHQIAELNNLAAKVATLNDQIRSAGGQDTSFNELVDQRNQLTTQIAKLSGATSVDNPDGTVTVLLGGNQLVEGSRANTVSLAGGATLDSSATSPVHLTWDGRPGSVVGLGGGELAGKISALAPSDSGGIFAEAADAYDQLATNLAAQVNSLHTAANRPDGTGGGDFFTLTAGLSPARGLAVAITQPHELAVAAPGQGNLDSSVADAIAALGLAAGGPDNQWAAHVTKTAVASNGATYDANLAGVGASAAQAQLLSVSSVSLDEESINLMAYQHAYQGSARVLTAVDEMLDVLINRTGLVGR